MGEVGRKVGISTSTDCIALIFFTDSQPHKIQYSHMGYAVGTVAM